MLTQSSITSTPRETSSKLVTTAQVASEPRILTSMWRICVSSISEIYLISFLLIIQFILSHSNLTTEFPLFHTMTIKMTKRCSTSNSTLTAWKTAKMYGRRTKRHFNLSNLQKLLRCNLIKNGKCMRRNTGVKRKKKVHIIQINKA